MLQCQCKSRPTKSSQYYARKLLERLQLTDDALNKPLVCRVYVKLAAFSTHCVLCALITFDIRATSQKQSPAHTPTVAKQGMSLVLAKCIPHCAVLLCKTGSQHACVTAITRMKTCCRCKCAVTHQQCTAALVLAQCIPHCPVLFFQTGSKHAFVTASTPIGICCSYKCAVTHK